MNLTSAHPFWSVQNGLPDNYPSLQHDVSCDVVVIGGGITFSVVAAEIIRDCFLGRRNPDDRIFCFGR